MALSDIEADEDFVATLRGCPGEKITKPTIFYTSARYVLENPGRYPITEYYPVQVHQTISGRASTFLRKVCETIADRYDFYGKVIINNYEKNVVNALQARYIGNDETLEKIAMAILLYDDQE